jgi:hypothetical protein
MILNHHFMQKCEFGKPISPPLEAAIKGTRNAGGGGKLGVFHPFTFGKTSRLKEESYKIFF